MSSPTYEPPAPRSNLGMALAAGAIVVLIGANIYLYTQVDHLRSDLSDVQQSLKAQGSSLGNLQAASSASAMAQAQHIEALKAESGTYNGTITITPTGGSSLTPVVVPVTLTVLPAPPVTANPASVNINYQLGGTANSPQQMVTLSTTNAQGVAFTISSTSQTNPSGGVWVVPTPVSGSITPAGTPVTIAYNTVANLPAGTWTSTVKVSTPTGSPTETDIPVTLVVASSPLLNVPTATLNFTYELGAANPAAQSVALTSTSTSPQQYTVSVSTTDGSKWLLASPTGATPTPLSVSVNPAGLAPGSYTGKVTVTGAGAGNSAQQIPVTLKVYNDPAIVTNITSLALPYHAFLEIPHDVLNEGKSVDIGYYSDRAAMDDARYWFGGAVNDAARSVRLKQAGIDPAVLGQVLRPLNVDGIGLLSLDEKTGAVTGGKKRGEAEAFFVPFVLLMLLYMMVMLGSMPQIHAVMEEKSQRIAEVLLGSASPFQIMAGKMLGNLGIALTTGLVYLSLGSVAVVKMGIADTIPMNLLPWFFAYLVLAVAMYGAAAIAVGSAVNDVKEAQSLTFPVLLPLIIPMFILMPVLKEPNGMLATVVSLVPPCTPLTMLLRQAAPGGIPPWQPWVGLLGLAACTLLYVWAGSRVFRIGLLAQGKTPKFTELIRWAIKG